MNEKDGADRFAVHLGYPATVVLLGKLRMKLAPIPAPRPRTRCPSRIRRRRAWPGAARPSRCRPADAGAGLSGARQATPCRATPATLRSAPASSPAASFREAPRRGGRCRGRRRPADQPAPPARAASMKVCGGVRRRGRCGTRSDLLPRTSSGSALDRPDRRASRGRCRTRQRQC